MKIQAKSIYFGIDMYIVHQYWNYTLVDLPLTMLVCYLKFTPLLYAFIYFSASAPEKLLGLSL